MHPVHVFLRLHGCTLTKAPLFALFPAQPLLPPAVPLPELMLVTARSWAKGQVITDQPECLTCLLIFSSFLLSEEPLLNMKT